MPEQLKDEHNVPKNARILIKPGQLPQNAMICSPFILPHITGKIHEQACKESGKLGERGRGRHILRWVV